MADLAQVRSPYIVEISGVAGDTTKVELFLWNDPGSVPANATYILEKPIPSTTVGQASYDISPYIREYIAHTTYTEITSHTAAPVGEYCYCNVKSYKNGILQTGGGSYTEELICFDGFGYWAQGQNPTPQNALLTEGTYLINDTGNSGGIYYTSEPSGTWTAVYTGQATGGTSTVNLTNTVGYIPYTIAALANETVTVEIKESGTTQYTYTFIPTCEPKYTTINCDFVNKHGAWQRLVFFKASRSTFEMTNKEYNLMPSDTDYSLTENRRKVFNVQGQESIKCNTGWVEEGYSNLIKELLMSETIRLDDVPVILTTKGVDLKKGINDNNINYELSFNYAFNALNYNV